MIAAAQCLITTSKMFLAQLTFGSDDGDSTRRAALEDAANDYLAALLKNGQIYSDWMYSWNEGRFVAYVHLARPNSLAKRYHSQWGKSYLRAVVESFGGVPACRVIDDEVPKRFRSWKRSNSFYLAAHSLEFASPLRCGDTDSPTPLYLLPVSDELRERIYRWAEECRDCDSVWLKSGALEIPGYKQLADPHSELSFEGRSLCEEIELATGKPTFYYLYRYWGRAVGEESRVCPLCGGTWRLPDASKTEAYPRIHFRCEPCRLVSCLGPDTQDARHARIGEFKPPSRPVKTRKEN